MKNYKMTIQYDGTKYQGWQRLKDTDKSIQGKIEDVLSRMCSHKVEIHGSGRTDAGVHAIGQVASFKIETDKTLCEIQDYLNRFLPEDIAVIKVCQAEDRFHARLTPCRKTYLYRINNSNISDVFERKYVYQVKEELDIDAMKKAASYLIGQHDFVGFSSLKKVKKSTVRTVYEVRIEESDNLSGSSSHLPLHKGGNNEVDIYITGDGFLYNMVRIIVGTLIEIGLGKRCASDIQKVLETKNRELAGVTAPAQGLTLYKVDYEQGELQ
ncbi:MAG: tRNA pseudouridine(38-40) synthase TruA [Clostridia bacterium]|nr:tRNA pseudouridine(38-40) synthase TruA [Clostridia bacterium]